MELSKYFNVWRVNNIHKRFPHITTCEQLAKLSEKDFLRVDGFGRIAYVNFHSWFKDQSLVIEQEHNDQLLILEALHALTDYNGLHGIAERLRVRVNQLKSK